MAAQTGSTYISGTMIDSVEIPTAKRGFSTMTSSNKLPNAYNKPNAYANVIQIQMLVVMTTTSEHLASCVPGHLERHRRCALIGHIRQKIVTSDRRSISATKRTVDTDFETAIFSPNYVQQELRRT